MMKLGESELQDAQLLAYLLGCLDEFVDIFADTMQKEFLPKAPAVARDWHQSLRMVISATFPIERVLFAIRDASGERSASSKKWCITQERWFAAVRVQMQEAVAVLACGESEESIAAQIKGATVSIIGAAEQVRKWHHDARQRITSMDESIIDAVQIAICESGGIPPKHQVCQDLYYWKNNFQQSFFQLTGRSSESERYDLELRLCMAARKYFLGLFYVAHFASAADPELWTDELKADAIELHDNAIEAMSEGDPRESILLRRNRIAAFGLEKMQESALA